MQYGNVSVGCDYIVLYERKSIGQNSVEYHLIKFYGKLTDIRVVSWRNDSTRYFEFEVFYSSEPTMPKIATIGVNAILEIDDDVLSLEEFSKHCHKI